MGFLGGSLGKIAAVVNPVAALSTLGQSGVELYNAGKDREAARDANQANINLSSAQMAFQERMSSTSHQREVADLKAAGLNPTLSANSGASTPAGSLTSVDPLPSRLRGLGFPTSALTNLSLVSDLRLKNAQSRNLEVDASAKEAELPYKKNVSGTKYDILHGFRFLRDAIKDMGSSSAYSQYRSMHKKTVDWFSPRKMREDYQRNRFKKRNTIYSN